MTLEIGILFLILGGMVYLFLTEKIPVDLTAFSGLVILVLLGFVEPSEAFSGFASPAVITMLSVFIVGASILNTGVADEAAERVHRWVGSREIPLVVTIVLTVAVLSAFMNNIAATAVLMPAVAGLSRQAGLSPSRLFMPLAFGAILGGTTTLVGTPPNILAAAMLEARGLEPFGLFDFTPVGLLLLGCGVLFLVTWGQRLLPKHEVGPVLSRQQNLAQVYQIQESLFSIRIPPHSPLDGLTLAQARLGTTLGVQVVAIDRGGQRMLAPEGSSSLRAGDSLIVEGRLDDLRELMKMQDLEVRKAEANEIPRPLPGVTGIRAAIAPKSSMIGRTLRQTRFRERFGAVVVGVVRGGEIIRDRLRNEPLQEEDEILAVGSRSRLEAMRADPDFSNCRTGLSELQDLESFLYLLAIPEGSTLAGKTLVESRLGEIVGITVAGIVRDQETILAPDPTEILRNGDRLLVAGEPSRVVALPKIGEVTLETQVSESSLESDEIGVVEAVVAPRSSLAGKSLGQVSFRERYGVQVLALWREGELVRSKLARLPLRFGDALLLQGTRHRLQKLGADPDLVVLAGSAHAPRRKNRAVHAVVGLLTLIAFVVSGFQPIHVASFTAATFVILMGAITMEESYRAIEWKAIFLVAAVLPVGAAMERTGAALMLAETVTEVAGPLGPHFVLASLIVLASLLSQSLDGAPTVVLLTPVVLQAAEQLDYSPYPLMMGISLAASAAFMTPFSHKANLLVMGVGGYRSADYLKVGTPLTVIILVVLVIAVPFFFPF